MTQAERERSSRRQSAPCADDREGPSVPRPARAAAPREDTTGSNATEARGSNDATRLSSMREIGDFPLAVRTRCVLTTLPDESGKRPESADSGNITRERRSLERQRVLEAESAEGFLDPGIPYLNTISITLVVIAVTVCRYDRTTACGRTGTDAQ